MHYSVENLFQKPEATLHEYLVALDKAVEHQFKERNDLSKD